MGSLTFKWSDCIMASERMVSTICEYFTFTIHLQIAKNTKLHVYFTENCVQASMGNY